MEINAAHYEESCRYHQENWALTDCALYNLCQCYPRHDNRAHVNAKVLLIGRGFASGIERNIKSSGAMGGAIGRLANHLVDHHEELDSILDRLTVLREPLNPEQLQTIATEHGRFCQLLAQITHDQKAVRSFASKYLHFHCPCVPMFDANAYRWAWKMRPSGRKSWEKMMVFPRIEPTDSDYYWFVLCFWHIYQYLRVQPKVRNVQVRLVDQYLLWYS